MTTVSTHDDRLAGELAGLSSPAPANFQDAVFARWVEVDGPVGALYVAFTDRGISYVCPTQWVGGEQDRFLDLYRSRFGRPLRPANRAPAGLAGALRSGKGAGLPYDLRSVGDFDRKVLAKTLEIPPGEVRPYAWIAREIGHPAAVRAAGSALGRNPVPILIPCHRVVRSDGATGNYGFGPQLKVDLLHVEEVNLEETRGLGRRGVHYVASDTTQVYCYPSCTHARRITPAHRVELANAAAASRAGYRACRHCRPG
ncbi:MAG: Methylated-DNA--protein-cysteine methyltransferase [uncultured Acidimicrobiales bacterium]|uniref:methylated-DNA--[protein]-cysteine S-methyltransferase n=1 Tax=uncultured Acidimicrobiales bacterium TaxID=310071 RepID=A0A6J4ISR6_9ACTN|nr:MAG: Methylated-DNA--protein-cysteine methyltransferase [uncultured Acidimicrobiales bacterium]